MDIKAIIMEEILDKRSDKDKIIQFIHRFMDMNYSPYMLKTRGGGRSGISSATAYQTKMIVDMLPSLSPEDLQDLMQMKYVNPRNNREYNFEPYLKQFQSLAGQKQVKADIKNISNDQQYSALIQTIKEKIEDFIVEQEAKIDKSVKESWQHIHNEYKTLPREEFQKKYGEKKFFRSVGSQPAREYYSMSMFEASRLGVLLRTRAEYLPEFIAKAQKAYREKEYGKIDGLIYKLKAHYPSLSNFVMTNFRRGVDGIEFTLTADNPDGKVSIYTQTIYAGGYNIQRLHLRWLMQVSDSLGKKVKIEQG